MDETTTGQRVAAALITLGIIVAFGSWVSDLLSCDDSPTEWKAASAERRDDWTVCERLVTCEVKAVTVAQCREWTKSPLCKPETLRAMADAFEAFPPADECAGLATYSGRADNPCVRW
jgi:hypothetical protein